MFDLIKTVIDFFSPPDQDWYIHTPLFAVRDADGVVLTDGYVMRKRVKGVWQYRAATDDEMMAKTIEDAM